MPSFQYTAAAEILSRGGPASDLVVKDVTLYFEGMYQYECIATFCCLSPTGAPQLHSRKCYVHRTPPKPAHTYTPSLLTGREPAGPLRATPCGQAFKKRLLPRKLSHHPFTTFFLEELVLGQACRRAAPAGARSPSSASAPSFRRDRREQRFRTCAISDACASRAFVASLRTPHLFSSLAELQTWKVLRWRLFRQSPAKEPLL